MQPKRCLLPLTALCALLALSLCMLPAATASAEAVPIGPDHAYAPSCPHCATAVNLNAQYSLYSATETVPLESTRRELRESPANALPIDTSPTTASDSGWRAVSNGTRGNPTALSWCRCKT